LLHFQKPSHVTVAHLGDGSLSPGHIAACWQQKLRFIIHNNLAFNCYFDQQSALPRSARSIFLRKVSGPSPKAHDGRLAKALVGQQLAHRAEQRPPEACEATHPMLTWDVIDAPAGTRRPAARMCAVAAIQRTDYRGCSPGRLAGSDNLPDHSPARGKIE